MNCLRGGSLMFVDVCLCISSHDTLGNYCTLFFSSACRNLARKSDLRLFDNPQKPE